MKKLSLILTLLIMSSARGAELVTSGQIGSIAYYAVNTTQSLRILLPWKVSIDIDRVEDNPEQKRYYVNVYGEIDTSLERSEIQTLRGKFPGYKVDAAVPTQLGVITMNIGDGRSVTIQAPPFSQNFFTTSWFLDAKAGKQVSDTINSGREPAVGISATATVPVAILGETYTLPLSQICPPAKAGSTVQTLLNGLVSALQPTYGALRTTEMQELVLATAIESCLHIDPTGHIESLVDVLKLPASSAAPVPDQVLTTDRVGTASQPVGIISEVTATVHQ